MPVVALDSNVVDLVVDAFATQGHIDASEAIEPPPRFDWIDNPQLEAETFATYWLITLARWWTSTLYTFSDLVYEEIQRAAHAGLLVETALDVLVREEHQEEYRVPNPRLTPSLDVVQSLGIKEADARHVADAVGVGASVLLTNDRQLRNRSDAVANRWFLRIRRPTEFLCEAVRAGAPWTTAAHWPWETLEAIRLGAA